MGDQQDPMELIREMQRQMQEMQKRHEAQITTLRAKHASGR